MNEKNFDFLKDNVKYLGFGEKQQAELQKNLAEGKDSFQLNFSTEINKKKFEATLQFRRSNNSDMYFLNNYRASLERSNGEKIEHTFYLDKGRGVTSKEAYNLLDGRSVHKELQNKEGVAYKAWIQLDLSGKDNDNFKVNQYHENYGYDLKSQLDKLPLNDMDGAEKQEALIHSLQKGNLQSVTLEMADGVEKKYFLEANPQFKTLNIYNDKMTRLDKEEKQGIEQKEAKSESESLGNNRDKRQDKGQSKVAKATEGEKPAKKNSRKRAVGV